MHYSFLSGWRPYIDRRGRFFLKTDFASIGEAVFLRMGTLHRSARSFFCGNGLCVYRRGPVRGENEPYADRRGHFFPKTDVASIGEVISRRSKSLAGATCGLAAACCRTRCRLRREVEPSASSAHRRTAIPVPEMSQQRKRENKPGGTVHFGAKGAILEFGSIHWNDRIVTDSKFSSLPDREI